MSIVEATLRGSAVAILLLLAVFYLRDARSLPSGRNRALFLLSAAAYTVCSAPNFARNDLPFGFPLLIVSLGVPALLWISAAAVFDDNFEPSCRRGIAWVGLVCQMASSLPTASERSGRCSLMRSSRGTPH